MAMKPSSPASGPKPPPVQSSGPPWTVLKTVVRKKVKPLTGKPNTLPWKKFQATWDANRDGQFSG